MAPGDHLLPLPLIEIHLSPFGKKEMVQRAGEHSWQCQLYPQDRPFRRQNLPKGHKLHCEALRVDIPEAFFPSMPLTYRVTLDKPHCISVTQLPRFGIEGGSRSVVLSNSFLV